MSDPIDDTAFEEYLKGDSLVSQRYREIGGAGVPARLDRRILQQAHAAVIRRPLRSRAWMRWGAPVALAASAVLVLSIVMDSGVRQETLVVSTPPAAAPDVAGEAERRNELPHAPPRYERGEVTHVVPVAPPAPAPILVPLPEAAAPVEQAPAAIARGRPAPRANVGGDVEAKRAQRRAAAGPSAAKSMAAEPREIIVTGNAFRDASPPSPAQVEMPIDTPSRAITQTTTARKQLDAAADAVDLDPQRWLENIRQLRRDGRSAEADREWERFRAAFPDYAVADDDVAKKRSQEEADSG